MTRARSADHAILQADRPALEGAGRPVDPGASSDRARYSRRRRRAYCSGRVRSGPARADARNAPTGTRHPQPGTLPLCPHPDRAVAPQSAQDRRPSRPREGSPAALMAQGSEGGAARFRVPAADFMGGSSIPDDPPAAAPRSGTEALLQSVASRDEIVRPPACSHGTHIDDEHDVGRRDRARHEHSHGRGRHSPSGRDDT